MIWSFSSYVSFKRCPRSWFYGRILATRSRSAPESREAKRLNSLLNMLSWRGKIVDTTLSECVVPTIARGEKMTGSKALEFAQGLYTPTAKRILDHQTGIGEQGRLPVFFEEEYCQSITQKMLDDAWKDVNQSIEMFFRNAELRTIIECADKAVPQRPLSFSSSNVRARAVPDLILFHKDGPPTVIDWKVQSRPKLDSWLQLGIYALALTRSEKHRDWPYAPSKFSAPEVRVIECQLLRGELREHQVTPEDVNHIDDLIVASDDEMGLSMAIGDRMHLTAKNFSTTSNPNACMYCNFKKICWVV